MHKVSNAILGINGTRFLLRNMPSPIKDFLKKRSTLESPPKLTPEDRLYLWAIFKKDVEQLEIMLDRNLSRWNPVNFSNS
jgi:hypothetical protein